ncbi:MAG TPA: hypothetical protein VGQ76_10895 [Thermoanaerobaculia bacterium]|jgi:hypothetical protein|nr:hypothetical protein [Thermoanaerobaculia bacterium]
MIPLLPQSSTDYSCPHCHVPLNVHGFFIPGMRNLAQLACKQCSREYYGDLRSGQAFYTPQLLEIATGTVHDPHGVAWFASWLAKSYANRVAVMPEFRVIEHRAVKRSVVFLNCLDTLYGHVLLKLLNAQLLINRSDLDLIVMVPRSFAWLVPDGAAQVWLVDWPLSRGTEWNDTLANEIGRRLTAFAEVHLSIAHSHPHPNDYDIERFTRVRPFAIDDWRTRLVDPTVTFIWRDDRTWKRRLTSQRRNVEHFWRALHEQIPTLNFAVAGLGNPGGLPSAIHDLRQPSLDASAERAWCERYAASHLVIGIHGSNMLLPSAHAGGAVELLPRDRWGNYLQDLLLRPSDARDLLFRYRFVPDDTPPAALAQLAASILTGLPKFTELMQ